MTGTLLWLIALGAMAFVAALGLRRMASLAGATRALERFKAEVVSINGRLAATVEPLVVHLDEIRRGARDPAEATAEVDAARATLRELSKQARSAKAPPALADRAQALVSEVDRAVRAADMAGHGVAQFGRTRHDAGTEALTALKRGTLGLRHAREAVARIMIGIAKLTPAEVRAMPVPSDGARSAGLDAPPADDDRLDLEDPPTA